MRIRSVLTGVAAVALMGLVAASHAQQATGAQQPSRVPAEGVSDVGSFEQVPYRLEPQLNLRTQDKMTLRKLEDKHIAELRLLEDRVEKDLRTLRARQQSERDAMIKGFGGSR